MVRITYTIEAYDARPYALAVRARTVSVMAFARVFRHAVKHR